MSYSGTPTLYGEQQIAAAYQSGTRLPVVTIAVGDGNGAAVTPTEGMTRLVNEVWRGPITSWGVDPADTRRIVVRTTIPPTAGPFTVREAGIFDSAGGMIAVTALAATKIVAPGTSNQATSIDLIVALPIGSAGAITVSPTLGERFTTERLIRTPFISINSASTATPPAGPAVGDLYIVPANPGGAWATATVGTIAEWNGIFWGFMAPPLKMVAGIMDAADDAVAEYLKWTGTAWEVLATAGAIFTVVDPTAASTADELVGTATPGLTALQPNMVFRFRQGAAANQTTVPKGNVSNAAGTALGDVPFTKADGSALAKGDLPPNADFLAEYDASGPRFRVLGPRISDFMLLIGAVSPQGTIVGNGYWRDPVTGFTIEWGTVNVNSANGYQTVTFPRAFTALFSVIASDNGASTWSTTNATFNGVGQPGTTGFQAQCANWTGNGVTRNVTVVFGWHAFGQS